MWEVTLRLTRYALILAAVPLLVPPALRAQPAQAPGSPGPQWDSPAPPRIGNIWDNLPHQPTQGDVGAAEQELGLGSSAQHEQQVDKELKDLGDELLNAEQRDQAVNGR